MRRETRLAQTFVELAEALVETYDLQQFLQTLVDRTVALVDAAAVGVLMTDEDGSLRLAVASSDKMDDLETFELEHEQGPCFEAFLTGSQVSEPDIASAPERWPQLAEGALERGYRSVHAFPLRVRDENLGALNVFLAEAGPFTDADVAAVQALADVAAIGISQERSVSRRREEQQAAIAQLGRVALRDLGAGGVLDHVVETVREVLGAPAVGLFELKPAGDRLLLRAGSGYDPALIGTATVAADNEALSGRTLAAGGTVVSTDLPTDERFRGASLPTPEEPVAAMSTAILGRDRPYGVLEVLFETHRTFAADDVAFLESVAGIVASIAARQEIETYLRQIQKLEAVGQLAGGVAHDFNNLLQVVKGNAELLSMTLGSPPREVDEILAAAGQGQRLVDRLLTFSRRGPTRSAIVDLNDTVTSVTDMLDRVVGSDITILRRLAEDRPGVVVDATQLEQAVVNLVINARDAMPGGGTITVTTAEARGRDIPGNPAGQFVRLTITDTGQGMSDDVLAQAFQPFFTTKAEGKGTGLGLSAVYGAISSADGHIDVRSEPGAGTTFHLFLPLAAEGGVADDGAASARWSTARRRAAVLVVEDRSQIRRLVESALQDAGYAVTAVGGAAQALEVMTEEEVVDLLVTDVTLPQANGRALAASVRERHPDLKVLYMSGYHATDLDQEPGSDFLRKPFALAELVERVGVLLR